jgi:histidine triad (HIT) family protein
MSDCLFCAIVAGDIPASVVHQDDEFVAFRDIAPQAPTHVVVVPRVHLADAAELASYDAGLAGRLLAAGAAVAGLEGLAEGYRFVLNTGRDGGQTVFHVHLHVLGGRPLAWPPG